jgi:hypothetical protein
VPPWIDFHGAALDLKVVSLSIRELLEEPLPSLLFSASSVPLRFIFLLVHERSDGISGGFCLEGGSGDGFFGKHIFSEMVLCTKCAPIDHFQSVGLGFERKADSPIYL